MCADFKHIAIAVARLTDKRSKVDGSTIPQMWIA